MATVHRLKTWPEYFKAIKSGIKTFELRYNDRNYQQGDTLILAEWDPIEQSYTGDSVTVKVIYIYTAMPGDTWGLEPGWCIMSIAAGEEGTDYDKG